MYRVYRGYKVPVYDPQATFRRPTAPDTLTHIRNARPVLTRLTIKWFTLNLNDFMDVDLFIDFIDEYISGANYA